METIAVYFTPLPFTKIVSVVGLKIAFHMGMVYTNNAGMSFGVTSGPSNYMAAQTPLQALDAMVKSAEGVPSSFGIISSDPKNNRPFLLGYPQDFYSQDYLGNPFPRALVAQGKDLSRPWRVIVDTYAGIGKLRLTYSPITQNSNSLAGTAIRRAGLPIPFSSDTFFAPGEFTMLPIGPARPPSAGSRADDIAGAR